MILESYTTLQTTWFGTFKTTFSIEKLDILISTFWQQSNMVKMVFKYLMRILKIPLKSNTFTAYIILSIKTGGLQTVPNVLLQL